MTISRGRRVVTAELALTAVSAAVGFGATRLFAGREWVMPVALTVVAVHGISAVARRNRLGIPLQALVVVLVEGYLLAAIFAGDTFRYVVPTGETFSTLGDALRVAIDAYPTARAPVEATDGFVLAFCIGLAIVALMADIAAFSLRAPLQALIPPFTLFVLCSLLGGGDQRLVAAVAFLVTSLTFVLNVRALDQSTSTTWMPGDQTRGPNSLLRLGGALIVVAASAALLIGPALPGAADEGLWTWRGGGGGPGSRFVVSPLVDLRARLVSQSSQIVFVVESPEPSYWRLNSLDLFDGTSWTSSTSFRDVAGNFGSRTPDDTRTELRQTFEIRTLGREILPAAYQPVSISEASEDVKFDDRSSTLLLEEDGSDLYNGFRYTVTSRVPSFLPDELREASEALPSAIEQRYLELPEIDPSVQALAEEITAGATNDYDRAILLQNHLREFEYSLNIPEGSDEDALVSFLFERRAGYCEQFAASFAVMARTLGIPSRVATGFTEGETTSARPDLYTVRGKNAHAWPEVYFRGVGWVPFEPTPNRVAPGSEAWTTLSEDDGGAADPTDADTDTDDQAAPVLPPELEPQLPEFDTGGGATTSTTDEGATIPAPLRALLVVGALVAAWFCVIVGAASLRRARRRARVAHDPAARIDLAWTEAVDAMARRGRVPRDSETRAEYAARVAVSSPGPAVPLAALGAVSAVARYSGEVPSDEDVTHAIDLAAEVVTASTHHLPWYRKVLVAGDPRRLASPRPRRARRSATVVSTA